MRKSYQAINGDIIRNIRTNELFLVSDAGTSVFVIVNQDTQVAKVVSVSTIRRWYKMEIEHEEPEMKEREIIIDICNKNKEVISTFNHIIEVPNGVLNDSHLIQEAFKFAENNGYEVLETEIPDRVVSESNRIRVIANIEATKPQETSILTPVKVTELVAELGLTIKVNKTNMAIKYGKKNVMELIYSPRKNHFTMLIRHDAITTEDRQNYEVNNDAKIVGKGYTLDLSIKTNSLRVFTKVLQDAKRYEVLRITR